ncbi:hypothetical protein [Halorubrum sp. AS12]|uniref:hypothetical protein n=1 Tax=Halorubrum sp. AS12 TaxID=3409687 RepID=UPI003DA7846E
MTRMRSLPWLSVGIAVCFVIGTVVLLSGASVVVGQNPDNTPYLNKTGDPAPIRIGQSEQNITNIEILLSNQTDRSEELRLYIDLDSIESRGVNTSSASISINNIQNGHVVDTQRLESQNSTLLRASIHPDSTSRSIQLGSVQISGINTSNAQKSTKIQYDLGINTGSGSFSMEATETTNTGSFKIIDGTIQIHDQATLSPQLHRDTYTTPGITVENLSGNINSTLFITKGKEDKIIAVRNISKNILRTKQAISVDTPYLGGDIKGVLVANSTFTFSNETMKGPLPSNVTESALSTDEGRMVTANINLANTSYNSSQTDKISIPNVKISDTLNDNTSFLVSLHPVNSTGYMLQNITIASSRVLTGWNENVSLYFNTTTHKSGIFRSNRYAAAIQLARGSEAGELISPKNSELLRNSESE